MTFYSNHSNLSWTNPERFIGRNPAHKNRLNAGKKYCSKKLSGEKLAINLILRPSTSPLFAELPDNFRTLRPAVDQQMQLERSESSEAVTPNGTDKARSFYGEVKFRDKKRGSPEFNDSKSGHGDKKRAGYDWIREDDIYLP